MSDRVSKFLSNTNYDNQIAAGAANGSNHRARIIPSKRDKERDAKKQRKARDWSRWDD